MRAYSFNFYVMGLSPIILNSNFSINPNYFIRILLELIEKFKNLNFSINSNWEILFICLTTAENTRL